MKSSQNQKYLLSLFPKGGQKLLSLVLLTLLLSTIACQKNVPSIDTEILAFHRDHHFHDVRDAIFMEDGAIAMVGIADNKPAILVLESNFSLRFYKQFQDYGKGGFQQVIERKNGELVMVGYVMSQEFGGGATDGTALLLRMTASGQLIEDDFRTKYGLEQYCVIHEDAQEQLVAGGYAAGYFFLDRYGSNIEQYDSASNPYSHITPSAVTSTADGDYIVLAFRTATPTALNAFRPYSFKMNSNEFSLDRPSEKIWSGWSQNTNSAHLDIPVAPVYGDVLAVSEGSAVFAWSSGDNFIYLAKMGLDSNIIDWDKKFYGNGKARYREIARYDKGYLLCGTTIDENERWESDWTNAYVLAVDNEGEILWEHDLGIDGLHMEALNASVKGDQLQVVGYKESKGIKTLVSYTLDHNGELITLKQ